MTEDQRKALHMFVRNLAPNILKIAEDGTITFDEVIYLLQEELHEVENYPHKYWTAQGVVYQDDKAGLLVGSVV